MASQRVVIPGHLVPALKGQQARALTAPTQALSLVIGLNLRNRSSLDALLKTQDDPHSKRFHHYLTPQQFTANFGPLTSTTQAVSNFLTSQGLHISSVSDNHAFISASGSISAVERAFAITLVNYAYQGRLVHAPTNEPSVPSALAGMIQGISGLDDVAQIHRTPGRILPAKHPKDPGGCLPNGYGPNDLYTAYNLWPLVNNGYNGTGVNVALVEFAGDNVRDVTLYNQCENLPALSIKEVSLLGGTQATVQGVIEADLDMEVLNAIAPGAQQIVYLAPNNTDEAVLVFDNIVNDTTYAPHIVSTSYTIGCENEVSSQMLAQLDNVFAQGAAQGIAFFTASGDHGANECGQGTTFGVASPASDPHVIAVGGTTYIPGQPEVAWDVTDPNAHGYKDSSGGGESSVFTTPNYQLGLSNYINYPNTRSVPDVAANAANYAEYCSIVIGNDACPGWLVNGGTSAATPLWAGIAADVNSYLSAQGKTTLGTASALLYQIDRHQTPYSVYHDVTSGCDYTNTYCAGTGYDLVTGIGTPNAWNLAVALVSQVQTNIQSEVVWGSSFGSTNDLWAASYQSDRPGWQATDLSQTLANITGATLSLQANAGQPAVISYPTLGDGTEMDVFALATEKNNVGLYGLQYLSGSDTWSNLGLVAGSLGLLPALNPVAVVENAPYAPQTALFGVSSSGHLLEYYETNADRGLNGMTQSFSTRDLSAQLFAHPDGSCDPGVEPAAVIYNGVPVVFADCGGKLVEFYDNGQGKWNDNAGIVGNNIPNASHAFPGHSLAAMVVPGNPATLEAYVASDRNGVRALTEYAYAGSWHAYSLPVATGHTPDQVQAQTVVTTTAGPTPISQVVTTDPASTSCAALPLAVQYLYQPQLSNPAWHSTVITSRGITGMAAIVEQSGTVFTEAYTGGYTGIGTPGAAGGGGCVRGNPINEAYSSLSSNTPQSWGVNPIASLPLDSLGVEPFGAQFPY